MTNCIVHIGYPKTGSTWFQNNFFPQVKNYSFVPRIEVLREQIIYPAPFDFNPDSAKDFFKTYRILNGNRGLILSDEGFLGGNEFLFKEYAQRLKEVFNNDAQIILFIRNQFTKIISSYSQYVKNNGGNLPIRKFLYREQGFNRVNNISFFNASSLKYDRIIQFYCDLFGKSNVHVFLYEDFANNPHKFMEDFIQRFNFEVNLSTIDFSRQNKGLRRRLFWLVRFGNRFTRRNRFEKHYFVNLPYWYFIQHRLINWLNQFSVFGNPPTPEDFFSAKDHQFLFDYYKEGNRNLLINYGLDNLKEYGYPL
jgi:hypothetical protein